MKWFNRFVLNKSNKIYAPINGKCIDITEVKDETFASKMLGDGIAIIPNDTVVKAPCDGTIQMLFKTNHAIGIKAVNGMEILLHIGIDTVELNGKGFKAVTKLHDKVRQGDPLLYFDKKVTKNYDMTTMMIVTNENGFKKNHLNQMVDDKMDVLERSEKNEIVEEN